MSTKNVFIKDKIYPDAKSIFKIEVKEINSIKNSCIYVLDTNALLIPYKTTPHSLNEIDKVFSNLIKSNQLIIPGQVAREFAANRPDHIKQVFQQINRLKDGIKPVKTNSYPLLEGLKEFKKIQEYDNKIAELRNSYFQDIDALLNIVKSWKWNDPVSLVYNKLFNENVIYDIKLNEDDFEKELENRYLHEIPPGYKDDNKPDKGVGDLIIWFTILEIGKIQKKDIVFISGEEKTDWYHRSEGQALYPRYELVSEFYRESLGYSFNILKLSDLMGLLGADKDSINEIKISEITSKNQLKKIRHDFYLKSEAAIKNYLITKGNPAFYDNDGFPDFDVREEGLHFGVEIVNLETNKNNLELKIRRTCIQAKQYIKENYLDFFYIFLVGYSPSDLHTYDETLNLLNRDFFSMNSDIIFEIGYLDDKNTFIKV